MADESKNVRRSARVVAKRMLESLEVSVPRYSDSHQPMMEALVQVAGELKHEDANFSQVMKHLSKLITGA